MLDNAVLITLWILTPVKHLLFKFQFVNNRTKTKSIIIFVIKLWNMHSTCFSMLSFKFSFSDVVSYFYFAIFWHISWKCLFLHHIHYTCVSIVFFFSKRFLSFIKKKASLIIGVIFLKWIIIVIFLRGARFS